MRVQYTIPGWEPAPAPGGLAAPDAPGMFETRLRESSAVLPPPSATLLGLDRPKPGDLALAPPSRPASLAFFDIDEDRRAWHSLLSHHRQEPPADPAAYKMLVLLAELQHMEDALTARGLMEVRG